MAHPLPLVAGLFFLYSSAHTVHRPIDIPAEMEPVGDDDGFAQSFRNSCFKGLAYIHNGDLHRRPILLEIA